MGTLNDARGELISSLELYLRQLTEVQETIPEQTTVDETPSYILFSYKILPIFNELRMLTSYKSRNIKTKEGVALVDDYAISEDETDLFNNFLIKGCDSIWKILTPYAKDIENPYIIYWIDEVSELQAGEYSKDDIIKYNDVIYKFPKDTIVKTPSLNIVLNEDDIVKNGDVFFIVDEDFSYTNYSSASDYLVGNIVYFNSLFYRCKVNRPKPVPPQIVLDPSDDNTHWEVYSNLLLSDFLVETDNIYFKINYSDIYDSNKTNNIDLQIQSMLKSYILKEWYYTMNLYDEFQLCEDRYYWSEAKLKGLLFQHTKKPYLRKTNWL